MIEIERGNTVTRKFESELLQRAYDYANDAHTEVEQFRKYTNEPYIVHPLAVAQIVLSLGLSEEAGAAALLHDVVEDTNRSLQDIYDNFGKRIGDLVEMLTDVSTLEDGNRKARKELDKQHTAMADFEGKTIKLADGLNNALSIIQHSGGFAYKWMAELEDRLEVLSDGHPTLYEKSINLVENFKNRNKDKRNQK